MKSHKISTAVGNIQWAGIAYSVWLHGTDFKGPGIESRWGRDFPHVSIPALGPTQPPAQWVQGHSRGKTAVTWH